MKRFMVITALFSVSILAVWFTFEIFAPPPPTAKSADKPIMVQGEAGKVQKANTAADAAEPVMGADMKIAPVFDTTGRIVSDPTGTILSAINPKARPIKGR